MKKLLFILVTLLGANQALADVDYTITWSVINYSDTASGQNFDYIDLDIQFGNRYVLVFGAISFKDNTPSVNVNGTCRYPSDTEFITGEPRNTRYILFCDLLTSGFHSYSNEEYFMYIYDNDAFSGVVQISDRNGVSTGFVDIILGTVIEL